MKYTLELDNEGRRYWLCEFDDGTMEPLPPGFALNLTPERWEQDGQVMALQIGTTVELTPPEDPKAAERGALMRVLALRVKAEYEKEGKPISYEDALALAQKTVDELAEGSVRPAIERARREVTQDLVPTIVPGTRALVEQLVEQGLGRKK
jgi:hypothetical protein